MKKFLTVILLVSCFAANVHARSFSLSTGLALDNYGYVADNSERFSTSYGGAAVTGDWLWPSDIGLRIGLGNGWAMSSNASGTREKPMHSICNLALSVTPYYEFLAGKWALDLGASAGCRVRIPYLNSNRASYIMTVSAGLGADVRVKYRIQDKWELFAGASAQRTVFDYLYKSYYPQSGYPVSGCYSLTLGVSYRFH